MKYLLKRIPGGLYVAMSGNPGGGSYTNKLQYAQVFDTVEQANRGKCENEMIVEHPHFQF